MKCWACWIAASLITLNSVMQVQSAPPLQRVPNTTLQMPTNPPSHGFTSVTALGGLGFVNPTVITSPPDETNRLFIAERKGRIVVITNLAAPTRTIFMDISSRVTNMVDAAYYGEEGFLGLAFHPGYATNGYFYVFYTTLTNTAAGNGRHDV